MVTAPLRPRRHPPAGRRSVVAAVRVVVAVALMSVAGLGAVWARPAAAHAELLQASPGPGQVAGGEIDFIDLAFLEAVTDVTVTVSRGGSVVPSTVAVDDGRIIRVELGGPLVEPGRYDVAYELTSADLHRVGGAFFFTYDPAATPAQRIGVAPPGPPDRNWVLVAVVIVLGGAVLALAGRLAVGLTRRWMGPPPASGPDVTADP